MLTFGVLTVDDWPIGMYAYQITGVLYRLTSLKRAPPLSHLSIRKVLRCAISFVICYVVSKKHGF